MPEADVLNLGCMCVEKRTSINYNYLGHLTEHRASLSKATDKIEVNIKARALLQWPAGSLGMHGAHDYAEAKTINNNS